jgi:hypothetical protein
VPNPYANLQLACPGIGEAEGFVSSSICYNESQGDPISHF